MDRHVTTSSGLVEQVHKTIIQSGILCWFQGCCINAMITDCILVMGMAEDRSGSNNGIVRLKVKHDCQDGCIDLSMVRLEP